MFVTEEEQRTAGFTAIAGVDEVGVAPLAGPVLAAAVILPPDIHLPQLNDSKQLTPVQRDVLYEQIMAVACTVHMGMATVEEIDRLNILQATRLAHRRAIMGLSVRPQLVLIDGRFPANVPVPQLVVIDGDATCASIAAASVVAKVTRDRLMTDLDPRYPSYGFAQHKGYGTKQHLDAIRRHGLTPLHRRSFLPVRVRQESLLAVEAT
jgi:ribonuclease HII